MSTLFKGRKRENINFNSPQEMYDDYKNREIDGVHDYQSKMIEIYMKEAQGKKDLALELPTGTGKTLIGMLIGEFRRRKNKERIVYVCPTNQLVNQTAYYTKKKYGIKATPFTGPIKGYPAQDKYEYETAQTIAVTNYSSLFNTNSFFKDVDIIIFDDAHSGENYIASNWTVTIDREKEEKMYFSLLETIKTCLSENQYNIMNKVDAIQSDLSWCDMVHACKLISKHTDIINLLDMQMEGSRQKYSWSNIRNNLHSCNIYVSRNEIIIRPYISPTLTHNVFVNAKQRIYMSATPGMSGELERAFGIKSIYRLPMVKDWKNKTIGRRFFMFPYASFDRDMTGEILKKITTMVNRGLVIVNDTKTQNIVLEFLNKSTKVTTFNSKDIEVSKEGFVSTENAFAVMASRFDGIDFPDDECRMLILFDLPTATHIQEKFLISKMAANVLFEERIKTRITQVIGRCTRGQTDYSAVCILGEELMNSLLGPKRIEKFNAELRAELEFGQLNAEGYENLDEYLELLNVFLNDREQWGSAEEEIISMRNDVIEESKDAIKRSNTSYAELMESAKYEVQAQYSLWKEDYKEALSYIDNILLQLQSAELKGYRGYWEYIAGYCCYNIYMQGDQSYESAYKEKFIKASKSTIGVNWFNSLVTNEVDQSDEMKDVYERIETLMIKQGGKGRKKFYESLDTILRKLQSEDGDEFEQGHKELGELAGYFSTNPQGDAEPDPIWVINNKLCVVAEDKIYESTTKPIPVKHIRQGASHKQWVRSKFRELNLDEDARIISLFVTNSNVITKEGVVYCDDLYYVNRGALVKWAESLISILKSLHTVFNGSGDLIWREKVNEEFRLYGLTPKAFVDFIELRRLNELENDK
ncbi:DEAD/DEAH box helicase family protein [Cellulosilyticum sp. ST5]|uniref:DEAD/DEAH box helicase family protein n=1 Tax=Cellulosilyticum sp. ST5 TaxID=3055805 RepID=UPI003977945A